MILASILVTLGTLVLAFLCVTPRGLVSPPTGFLLRLSALLARTTAIPREVAARRRKNDGDVLIVSAAPSARLRFEDRTIPGPGGPIALRLYRPADSGSDAVLMYIHGGGWALGGIASADPVARLLCSETGALVVSLDYRLAPEHPFPAAIDDVMAAYEWILGETAASRLLESKSARKVFVSGDSAGGGLSASLCLLARERALAPPAGQILFYPVTDISRTDRPSYALFAEGFLLDRGDMEWFISMYAPDASQRKDPRASPLLAPDLANLPPALILTAAFDVLRDEGEAYAAGLRAAGVDVESRRMRGLVHGFLSMSRFVPSARRCARMAAAFMRDYPSGG